MNISDLNAIFRYMKRILRMLDKIYHAMGLDEEEE